MTQHNMLCDRETGKIDRKYLRVCAVYRLLSRARIDKAQAVDLIALRHTASEMRSLRNTVALWSV